ncbi:MAG TPA: DMT family transporter, partial [Tepidisphaeraceae bacterium]|nr:DMT family transporter [Tepidisphaeraceae bacterium]
LKTAAVPASVRRTASLALLLATVFWGCGFTWAKAGASAVHKAATLPDGSSFGPVFLLAWRFTAGGIIWLLLFPAARRGWTRRGAARSAGVGALLALGLILQHIGLDSTSEAVSAFLTSLTILFVPLLLTFAMKKPPRPLLWMGVALATAGIWLMTGATPSGFGKGEFLGLACALAFSVYILAVNAAAAHDTPWRMTAGQFIVVGLICFLICGLIPGGAKNIRPAMMEHILSRWDVWVNVILLAVFPTIAAFGLLTHFQPRLDPTQAALLYLIEPIVAASYAAIAVHHLIDRRAAAGAALILVANALVELLSSRRARRERPMLLD